MSKSTLKMLTQVNPTPIPSKPSRTYGRCLLCGKFRLLTDYKGFSYCLEHFEEEKRFNAVLEYFLDFSIPYSFLRQREEHFK